MVGVKGARGQRTARLFIKMGGEQILEPTQTAMNFSKTTSLAPGAAQRCASDGRLASSRDDSAYSLRDGARSRLLADGGRSARRLTPTTKRVRSVGRY
jgi:hypothetical protein